METKLKLKEWGSPRKQATLLVVDDTPENLAILGNLLQPTYQVRAANSGQNALRTAASTPKPDLILLDAPMAFTKARDRIAAERGRHFDPDVVKAFLTCFDTFVAIVKCHGDGREILYSAG